MRKMNKKNAILACLSLSLAMGAVGVATLSNKTVSANATFKMEKGASLYLDEVSGLKFSFTDSAYDAQNPATYGMLIVPFDYLVAAGIEDIETETDFIGKLNQAYTSGAIQNKPITQEVLPQDGVFSHSVGSLYNYNYVREFFGIGYKEVSEGVYEYAQPADGYTRADNVRSVFEVANLALNYHVYDNGDLNGDGNVDAEETNEYNKISNNKTNVENFVDKGLSFVYTSWDGKSDDYDQATLALTLQATYIDTENKIAVNPTVSTEKNKAIDLKMHWRADTTTATRGTAQPVDIMLAGVKTVADVSTSVLKDKDEYELYNSYYDPDSALSADEAFFDATATAIGKGDGSLCLSGGYWQSATTSGINGSAYVAFKNANVDDGQFTLEKGKGWYTEFYFKGNNMPIVEFFGTDISKQDLGNTTATGYVVHNGQANRSTYQNRIKDVMKLERNINDTTMTTDTDVNTAYAKSTYKFGGLTAYSSAFRYGVSAYGNFDNGNLTSSTGISSDKNFKTYDTGATWNMMVSNASSTMNNCSLFSQVSLIMNGTNGTDGNGNYLKFTDDDGNLTGIETANWHYVVGMYLDENNQVWIDSKLYKVNDDNSETEWATMNKALAEGALAEGTVRKGYISVYGTMKGSDSVSTYLAYKKPYEQTINA